MRFHTQVTLTPVKGLWSLVIGHHSHGRPTTDSP